MPKEVTKGDRAMLSAKEVAAATGLQPRAIYKAIERGELPAYRLCGRLKIDPAEFENWKAGNRVDPRQAPSLRPLRSSAATDGLRRLLGDES